MARKNTCSNLEPASRLVIACAATTLTLGLFAPLAIAGVGPPVHALMQELEGDFSNLPEQDAEGGPRFGFSTAMYGDTLVVGAPGARQTGKVLNIRDRGMVFVYRRLAGQWQLTQRLSPGFGPRENQCGYSVALDAFNLLVGCPFYGTQEQGLAQLYTRSNPTADFQSSVLFVGPEGFANSQCGRSVALIGAAESGSFPFATVGCPGRNNGQGAVDIHFLCPFLCIPPFEPGWNLAASLDGEGSGGGPGTTRFGRSVSLGWLNSVLLAVGAPRFGAGNDGRVWLYSMGDTVADWTVRETFDGTDGGRFGFSVHLRDNVIVAGAPERRVTGPPPKNAPVPVGSFSVATALCATPPPAPCIWSEAQEFVSNWNGPVSTEIPQNRLGHAVHVLATGLTRRVIAGEPDFSVFDRRGRARHLRQDLNNGAGWVQSFHEPFSQLPSTQPDDAALGTSLTGDGGWLAIGAPGYPDPEDGPRGRVFVYAYDNDLFNDRFEHPPLP